MKREQEQQKERAGVLRDLLDSLALIMTDAQVMEASNAATNFRNLLAIDRWLQRDWAALVARHSRLPVPEEVVPANYRLRRQDELGSDAVIPAEIVGIGARQCAMTVFARFPGNVELAGENEFIVGFEDNDQRLEIVEFQRVDPTTGAYLDTPPGALAGLYGALITTCRDELDQWRINAAHLEDIELAPAILPEPLTKPPEDA
jgi:hypothetical protein